MKLLIFCLSFFLFTCSDYELNDSDSLNKTSESLLGSWNCMNRLIRVSGVQSVYLKNTDQKLSLSLKNPKCEITYSVEKKHNGYSSRISCQKTCDLSIQLEADYLLVLAYKDIKEKMSLNLDCSYASNLRFMRFEKELGRIYFRLPVQASIQKVIQNRAYYEELECYVQK